MRRITSVSTPVAHLVGPGKLKVVNGHLAYSVRGESPLRLDPATLRAVYCYGEVGVTDEALLLLFRHEVGVAWLSPAGNRCRGRLVRSDPSKTTLRLLQHRAFADAELQRQWAARVVAAKIESQIQAARHYQRQGGTAAGPLIARMQALLAQSPTATLPQLRGLEGSASAAWFDLLGSLLLPPWRFVERNRRPPRDPVNALLSLGYTWLLARTITRCEAEGLEVNLGALHEYRPGRPSLACDLMEPLRTSAVDRWVIGLCNQQKVSPEEFLVGEHGVCLQPRRFPAILHLWEEFWQAQQQEAALDRWLSEFLVWVRQTTPPESDEGTSDGPVDL
jgi:CRISP-associated protein Cas1